MGGYILFEIWRIAPQRVAGLILCNTRADPDSEEGKQARCKAIDQIKVYSLSFHSNRHPTRPKAPNQCLKA
jgi:pimeloyl-ACP methyl ester carboxylesterase